MSWSVLGVATISLWGILLVMGNLELANAPSSPCHHHIDAAYDCSMYYQLSNLFFLPRSTCYNMKLQPTTENITHP